MGINCNLTAAILSDDTKKLKQLLKTSKPSKNPMIFYGYNLLRLALRHKKNKSAELLIQNGVKMNRGNNRHSNTPLHYAVKSGDIKIVKRIIRSGVDINKRGTDSLTPLHVAAKYDQIKVMEYLLQKGADVTLVTTAYTRSMGFTALHFACDSVRSVKLLLKYNAPVNPVIRFGIQPIQLAVSKSNYKVTALLLNQGVRNINIRYEVHHYWMMEFEETTPYMDIHYTLLHLAVCMWDHSSSLIKTLLKYGADVNAVTINGNVTPLMLVTATTNLKVTKLLLSNGARVNDISIDGMTALHCVFINHKTRRTHYSPTEFALQDVKLEIVSAFVNRQVDLDIVVKMNGRELTAFDLSLLFGYEKIAIFLMWHSRLAQSNITYVQVRRACFHENFVTQDIANDEAYLQQRRQSASKIVDNLLWFIVTRHAIGISASEKTLRKIKSWYNLDNQYGALDKLICSLKNHKIGDTNVSYWHFLTWKMNDVLKFSFSKDFETMNHDEYSVTYPEYRQFLAHRIAYCEIKRDMIETVYNEIYPLLKNELPWDCCEKIVWHLNDHELIKLDKNFRRN